MCINSFNSVSSSFAPTKNSTNEISKKISEYLGFDFKYGCDLPENGGITGQMGKRDKPSPFVLEERPTTIDWKTGERVYRDTIKPKYACWMA